MGTLWALLRHWQPLRRLPSRVVVEDALMHLHQRQHSGRPASTESLAGALGLPVGRALALVRRMEAQGLLAMSGDGILLSPRGHRWALQVVRAHRLYERYLADETGVPVTEIHRWAHRREHGLTPRELDKLDADLGHPAADPHGDPIPTPAGHLPPEEGRPLVDWPLHTPARIVHIEDEPPEAYAQVAAAGLAPGTLVEVVEATPARLVIEADAAEHILAPVVAATIAVQAAKPRAATPPSRRLSELALGERARVAAITPACQGLTRRRFLDLGITPGVWVEPVMRGAFGEPTAYRVRDTLIALRREQADTILIER
ncbi:MAG: hypothetical protein GX774_17145 [Armatimonadetes bacterium]|nr:hypothetical protein [Armatimonadota bacterium]